MTKTAMPSAMAKTRRKSSLSPRRRPGPNLVDGAAKLGPGPSLASASARGDGTFAFLSAEGCATTTRLGSALTSRHPDLESARVLHRVLAVPHDAVDELRGAHHVPGQVRLGHRRGLPVDLDLVHLLRHLEVVRLLLEQAPAA